MLAKIATVVGNFILEWAIKKIARLLSRLWRKIVVKKEAKESVKPLKEAKTGEEIDQATDDALSGM